ncbi:MAG: type III secretion system export apparatus subunit SctS [Duodenibacillus sp.]|nr:type III secretion system export apparatus subunit SctS [Duodenibacillus sp.]
MNTVAMEYASQSLYLVLMISLPPIIVAAGIGITLSLIQAVTQLQEQTLVFGIKLMAVVGTLFMLGGWMSGEIMHFAAEIFDRFYLLN